MMTRRMVCAGLATILSGAAWAGLSPVRGEALLTLTGRIGQRNAVAGAQFDLAMLDALAQGRFFGETPWTRGSVEFTGPLLSAVLEAAGAVGQTLIVSALNDYTASVPYADLQMYKVILATRRDGRLMSVRERGPLWMIYPMDVYPDLRTDAIFARSVWQIATIQVL